METKEIRKLYVRYKEAIDKLGQVPLTKHITIEGLGWERSVLQSSYRDIRRYKLERSFHNFICYIAKLYLDLEWEKYPSQEWADYCQLLLINKNEAFCYFRLINEGHKVDQGNLLEVILAICSLELAQRLDENFCLDFDSDFAAEYRRFCMDKLEKDGLAGLIAGRVLFQ